MTSERSPIDALAQEIRRVDGSHSLGAGALAEALTPFLAATPQGEAVGRYITFSPSSEEGNAVVYPETPSDGVYWTLIGSGPDLDQNALAQQIVTRLNMTPPPTVLTGEGVGGALTDWDAATIIATALARETTGGEPTADDMVVAVSILPDCRAALTPPAQGVSPMVDDLAGGEG